MRVKSPHINSNGLPFASRIIGRVGPGAVPVEYQHLADSHIPEELGQSVSVPLQIDVYFFSTRIQTNQHWGTPNPITIRDKEFGAVRLRGFGIYPYQFSDAKTFYSKVSGTRDVYRVEDLEGQLRNTIVGHLTDTFASSNLPFLDMAANQVALSDKIAEQIKPGFAELGATTT